MIWEHDHHCDHAEDIVIECGGELSSDLRSNFEEELEEEDRTRYSAIKCYHIKVCNSIIDINIIGEITKQSIFLCLQLRVRSITWSGQLWSKNRK